MEDIYIVSGARTAIGDFGGTLKDFMRIGRSGDCLGGADDEAGRGFDHAGRWR
jgi:hypothetical protein